MAIGSEKARRHKSLVYAVFPSTREALCVCRRAARAGPQALVTASAGPMRGEAPSLHRAPVGNGHPREPGRTSIEPPTHNHLPLPSKERVAIRRGALKRTRWPSAEGPLRGPVLY